MFYGKRHVPGEWPDLGVRPHKDSACFYSGGISFAVPLYKYLLTMENGFQRTFLKVGQALTGCQGFPAGPDLGGQAIPSVSTFFPADIYSMHFPRAIYFPSGWEKRTFPLSTASLPRSHTCRMPPSVAKPS